MAEQPDILAERLGELRKGFLQRLDARLSIISAASEALIQNDASHEERLSALSNLHAEAHKLVGTAGVLGFHELSGLAHKVEIICQDRMRSDLSLTETDVELVGYFRSSLHRAQHPVHHRELVPTSPAPASQARRSSDRRCTILLVDDDEIFSQAVALEIEQHGYRAVTINDPAELGATIDQHEVNLVLMDIMFGTDDLVGLFVTWELKKEGKLVCPVIMMSSRGDFDARLAAVRAGCSGYLAKPFIIADLLTEIDRLVIAEQTDPYRVLIIDDDPDFAKVSEMQLTEAGMQCKIVANPLQTLGRLKDFKPDILLMDVEMPDCNGFELAAIVRQFPEPVETPIIFLTTQESKLRRFAAGLSGGDAFIEKSGGIDVMVPLVRSRAQQVRALRKHLAQPAPTRNRPQPKSSSIGVWERDLRSGMLRWTEQIPPMFGLPAGAMDTTFEKFLVMLHPDDLALFTAAIADCLAGSRPLDLTFRIVRQDGTVQWLWQNGSVRRDAAQNPVQMLGVICAIEPL